MASWASQVPQKLTWPLFSALSNEPSWYFGFCGIQIHCQDFFKKWDPNLGWGKGMFQTKTIQGDWRLEQPEHCYPVSSSREKSKQLYRQRVPHLTNAINHNGKAQWEFAIRSSLGSSFRLSATSDWAQTQPWNQLSRTRLSALEQKLTEPEWILPGIIMSRWVAL